MSTPDDRHYKGAIAWMARNPVAANLLMAILVFGGIIGMLRVEQEVFPEFDLDAVSVSVPYPGASPAEVEQGIVLAVEEAVTGVDGVKRVTSTSSEGVGTVNVELLLSADPDKALADVKSAVDRITSFPEEVERPTISLAANRQQVVKLIVAGDLPLSTLHGLAERARSHMLAHPDVTQVEIEGVPPLEISIELSEETLEAYGLTLEQVAAQVRAHSVELPGGRIKTEGGELLVRMADRRTRGQEYADIVIRGTADGAQVRLGDIATIRDGYADTDLAAYYNGRRAVRVAAYRVGAETPKGVSAAVHEVLDDLRAELPPEVELAIWDDDSEILAERVDLLIRNARLGLVLVVLVLAAFLDLRLAFWVALGIPISFLGAFFLMPAAGMSINMISLFAFILTLGMVVDDAIVVGENIFAKEQAGMPRMQAAIEGAREMAVPVTFSILTTFAAFAPLLMVPGVMGKIFRVMPVIVVLVLGWSLVESFFVLPAHLGHGKGGGPRSWPVRAIEGVRRRVAGALESFTENIYAPLLERVVVYRYLTMSVAVATFVLAVGVVGSGIVPFSFFPKLEGNVVSAAARLPYGTPVDRTAEVARILEDTARRAVEASGGESIVRGTYTVVGQGARQGWGPGEEGAHLTSVEVELVPADQREVSSKDVSAAWQSLTPAIPGVEVLSFNSTFGPGAGAAVDVQLSHPDADVLAAASEELATTLRSYPALANIENGWAAGKPQLDFHLLPAASSLGLTSAEIARQLRSAFFGAEAVREQRGRNELKVMVRLPEHQRRSEYDLERMTVRTPGGGEVPLSYVAEVERGRAPTSIIREKGQRVVNVTAELAPTAVSSREVLESLAEEVLPELKTRYPRLQAEFVGEQREQGETFAALGQNFLLGLFAIYALLAIPFKSYVQPVIVMAAIPMGFVGAVAGHLLMGFELSLMSMFGLVALAGVVVNDSLVLIDATNQKRREGASAHDAILSGGVRRLRPILLTSLTTFFGLAPMILETSIQARFLIPMAISLGFGVLFATLVILLLVPALYMAVEDAVWAWAWLRGRSEAPVPVALSPATSEAYTPEPATEGS